MKPNREPEWKNRHVQQKASHDADQAELKAMLLQKVNVEEGIRDDRTAGVIEDTIAEEITDSTTASKSNWARRTQATDELAGRIADEIARRQKLMGTAYPFRLDGNRISYFQSGTGVYEFCLSTSLAPSLSAGALKRLPIAFERLARDVLIIYAGNGAKGFRTGAPTDPLEKRPARLKEIYTVVNEQCAEWEWNPNREYPDDPDPKDGKDLGLDVLVWKDLPDGRCGKLFFMGQCACGRTDWTKKFDEPDIKRLQPWFIYPVSFVPPLKCFFVPFHIPNGAYFHEINTRAGLTLDRARIVLLAELGGHSILKTAKENYFDLAKLALPASPTARSKRKRQRRTRAAEPRSQ